MSDQSACPELAELNQLLDGSLSEERQSLCTSHMDYCTCCQSKLEELATSGSNISSVLGQLQASQPEANSAYWPALKALDDALSETNVPLKASRSRDLSLDFLGPPSDSAYLGRVDQFDVMRVLGRGGMGVVLEAFDSRLQRHVALKFLDPDLVGDAASRQRFCREARTAASITHENVVAVHQVETSGESGLPYLVMQLINGESLEQRLLREPKLPVREIVRISMETAHGLAAAHSHGLIHRDIKPANILLESAHHHVKLTDFGLARAVEDVKLTATGLVTGTPLYMAPEQALGEPLDARSDLFSLGVVMYELCAGQAPFTGNSALAILRQITEAKPRPIRELNPAIPKWLAETVEKLLAKKPADRIQTAHDLAELLVFEWALLKTTSDEVPNVCEISERKRTVRTRWILFGVGATFLAMGLFGGNYLAQRNRSATSTAPAPSLAEVSPTVAPVSLLSANAGVVWSVGFRPGSDTAVMAVEDGTIRLWDVATQSMKSTVSAHHGAAWASSFSGNGKLMATSGDDGLVKIWDETATEPTHIFEHPNVRGSTFANQQRTIFSGGRDGSLRAWSLESKTPIAEARQAGTIYAMAVSPDDQTLATAGTGKVIELWNASTLTKKLPLEGHTGPIYGLSFHPDGRRLASAGWDKKVRIWDAGSGSLIKTWDGHNSDIWSIVYSPDGKLLITGGTDGILKVWDAESGELRQTIPGHETAIHALAFHPDGNRVASGGRDGVMRIWKID